MKVTLEAKSLILRLFRMDDVEAMFHGWASNPEVAKYVNWNTHETIEETRTVIHQWVREYEKTERLNFATFLRDSGQLLA